MNWINVLLAAITAYYFGWKSGHEEATKGVKPGEIVIEGKRIVLPSEVYQYLKQYVEPLIEKSKNGI